MLSIGWRSLFLFWILKYVLYFVILSIINQNAYLYSIYEIETSADLFYYLWLFLFFPICMFLVSGLPILHATKKNGRILFMSVSVSVLAFEYVFYTMMASTSNFYNGAINLLCSVLVFVALFYARLKALSR